jgi:hypothetical protein
MPINPTPSAPQADSLPVVAWQADEDGHSYISQKAWEKNSFYPSQYTIPLVRLTDAQARVAELERERDAAKHDADFLRTSFKNFHRSLCVRFGYVHDDADWYRDQVSLEEHIALKVAKPAPLENAAECKRLFFANAPFEHQQRAFDAAIDALAAQATATQAAARDEAYQHFKHQHGREFDDARKWRKWHEAQMMIEEHMPEGYRVILECSPGDWSLSFRDPEGEDIQVHDCDSTEDFICQAVTIGRAAMATKAEGQQ